MKRRDFALVSALTFLACLGTISCSQSSAPSIAEADSSTAPSETVELTISVAASVQEAMRGVQALYEEATPGVTITYNFGSSGSLAQQIIQGAPADVFLSASTKWMDDLDEKGQILDGTREDLLLNSLVLIVPLDKDDVIDFSDLATDKVNRVAIGEPESVPAGGYAKETLTSLNLFGDLQPRMVFGKDVWQVLSYVETGNVDAGLLYATDANVSDQVRVVMTAPADTHSPIIYPIGVMAGSKNAGAAQAFIDFLSTELAVDIFKNYGFTMAE